MPTQWGRKETVIWPPQVPIYSYGTLLLAFPIALALLCGMYAMKPFLARNYTGAFIQSAVGELFSFHGSFRLIYLGGGKRLPRVAVPDDFTPGSMTLPDGKEISVALSSATRAQGYSTVFRGEPRKFADARIHYWLQSAIFGGDSLLGSYAPALVETAIIVVFMLCFAVPYDFKRGKRMKYGRRLRGPEMLTPGEFNKTLQGDGMGIRTNEKGTIVRLPGRSEPKHIQVMGDTGVGKTTLLIQMLSQIEDRGDSAIIYDPAGEFIQRFYRKDRHDVVLNPLDARSPYWTPSGELKSPAEARTIAASLYQPTSDKQGEFFTETPQKIFAHMLKYRPSPQDLVAWMSNASEIDRRVKGTELAAMISPDAQDQRQGVLASLGLIADSLRLLKTQEQAGGREPEAAKWASALIGEIEIERVRETVADGKRAGKSFILDRQIEPLVMGSEIEGLDDLHAFLKLGNHVTRFSFPHMDRDIIAPAKVPRNIPEGEWLRSLPAEAAAPAVAIPAPPVETPVAAPKRGRPRKPAVPKPVAVLPPAAQLETSPDM